MRRWPILLSLVALAGCTPLGLWLYEDPTVSIADLRINTERVLNSTTPPVQVVLALKNTNDYDLQLDTVAIALQLDGVPLGDTVHVPYAVLTPRTTTELTVPLPPPVGAGRRMLDSLRAGSHDYRVMGRVQVATPIGERLVKFALASRAQLALGSPCHRQSISKLLLHNALCVDSLAVTG